MKYLQTGLHTRGPPWGWVLGEGGTSACPRRQRIHRRWRAPGSASVSTALHPDACAVVNLMVNKLAGSWISFRLHCSPLGWSVDFFFDRTEQGK